jgi:hypothetical protein
VCVLRVALSVGDEMGGSPPPPFIDTRRGEVHVRGDRSSRRLPPNKGCAVAGYYWKYTVGYWRVRRRAWKLSWAAPWSCGDRAGILVAHVGVVVVAVEGTVLHAWRGGVSRVLREGVLLWSRPGPCSRVAPMPVEGSAGEEVRGGYGELAAQWQE